MHLSMYRDVLAGRELVADIEFEPGKSGTFSYDEAYVARAKAMGELGISERLPVDSRPYAAEEFGPFFRGLLPEGSVYGNLAQMYQVPRNDYLSIIARLGCESIGALTFVADGIDPGEYEPHFEPLTDEMVRSFGEGPLRAVTRMTSETRLSLSGAQSKVAWCIEEGVRASEAEIADWSVPRGTAPSSHIIKVSAPGEEEIAYNELVCSLIARACGMEVACVDLLPFLPGAIAVQRYDRQWVSRDGKKVLSRLHQEDFCQALGLPPHLKYQVEGLECSYLLLISDVIDAMSAVPRADRLEFAKRLAFNYAVGNSDAHLKNASMLYNRAWTMRRLAPVYDVTYIPLTGYSTRMEFDIGSHRELSEIDERDIMSIALDLDVSLADFDSAVREVVHGFEVVDAVGYPREVKEMLERVVENAKSRLDVLKRYLGTGA